MSNKSQRGDTLGIIIIVSFVFFVVANFVIWNMQRDYERVYQQWTHDCRQLGGIVQNVSPSRSECFVNNEKVVVKGYEQYQ